MVSKEQAVMDEIGSLLRTYWQECHRAYLDGHPCMGSDYFFGENSKMIPPEESAPESVKHSAEFYNDACSDWGGAQIFHLQSKNLPCWIVSVTTDGDDGWIEVFDESGKCFAAARRYIELLSWGPVEKVRAYTEDGEFPEDMSDRMMRTLWARKT